MSATRSNAHKFRRRDASVVTARFFGPNMTPMVDIVMVILIFFMAGSAFIGPEWFLDVAAARATQQADDEGEPAPAFDFELPPTQTVLRLTAAPDGSTLVTGMGLESAPLRALADTLRAYADTGAAAAVRIVIEPEHNVRYQDVISVYDACRDAGAAGVALARGRRG